MCKEPLTDLHKQIIAIAKGLSLKADPMEYALVEAEVVRAAP